MNNDIISRQAALDIYDDYNVAVENGELEAYRKHRERLLELPSAQPFATDTNIGDIISRQEAIDELVRWGKLPDYNDGERNIIACTIGMLSALPSAQPEIIRCKDCKQFRRWIDTDICFCDITESERLDNDFCSRAERRTDERSD